MSRPAAKKNILHEVVEQEWEIDQERSKGAYFMILPKSFVLNEQNWRTLNSNRKVKHEIERMKNGNSAPQELTSPNWYVREMKDGIPMDQKVRSIELVNIKQREVKFHWIGRHKSGVRGTRKMQNDYENLAKRRRMEETEPERQENVLHEEANTELSPEDNMKEDVSVEVYFGSVTRLEETITPATAEEEELALVRNLDLPYIVEEPDMLTHHGGTTESGPLLVKNLCDPNAIIDDLNKDKKNLEQKITLQVEIIEACEDTNKKQANVHRVQLMKLQHKLEYIQKQAEFQKELHAAEMAFKDADNNRKMLQLKCSTHK